MQFTLTINCDNDAFKHNPYLEIAGLLLAVADRVNRGTDGGSIHDVNGNRVGEFHLNRDEE